jgi:hypothetical protein
MYSANIPRYQPMVAISNNDLMFSRLSNLAFAVDHYLGEVPNSDLEATDEDLATVTQSIEGNRLKLRSVYGKY